MKPSKQDLNSGFLLGLCWIQIGSSSQVRIPNLPSWSWTGWSGTVRYEDETLESLTSVVKIFVELRDGSVLDWSEYQRRYAEINNSVQLSHFIHVWAPTFEIHNLSKETSQSYNYEIKMNDGWFLQWNFFIYQDGSMLSQCQKCFVMPSSIESRKFIVFLKQCENSFERIWGCWTHHANISLLRPDRETADLFDLVGSNITERYGTDWEKSIASTWETLRIGWSYLKQLCIASTQIDAFHICYISWNRYFICQVFKQITPSSSHYTWFQSSESLGQWGCFVSLPPWM